MSDTTNDTPLHIAVRSNNVEMVKTLLDGGASPNVKNNEGLTPLHLAVQAGHTEIVNLLVKAEQNYQQSPKGSNKAAPTVRVLLPKQKRKDLLLIWLLIYLSGHLSVQLVGIAFAVIRMLFINGDHYAPDMDYLLEEFGEITRNAQIVSLPFLIVMGVGFFFFLRKLWEEIPQDIARTTPENAAGRAFIPVYHFYWWFVAFVGLTEDMRKTSDRFNGKIDLKPATSITVYVFWVVTTILTGMIGRFAGTNGGNALLILLSVAMGTVTTYFMVRLYGQTIKLINMKTDTAQEERKN